MNTITLGNTTLLKIAIIGYETFRSVRSTGFFGQRTIPTYCIRIHTIGSYATVETSDKQEYGRWIDEIQRTLGERRES